MVFPATPAVVTLRMAFGADLSADPSTWTWTDVTGYWEAAEPVTVQDGRSEGATQAEASEATITLDATDGAMMPEDPRSVYWPHVDVGTPVWMTLDAGSGTYDLVRGFVSALTPVWPGRSRYLCWTRMTVRGLLDRLGRGASPLRVPLERAILGDAPVGYWPLADGQGAAQGAAGVPDCPAMTVQGAPAFATIEGPLGSPGKYPEFMASSDAFAGVCSSTVDIDTVFAIEVSFRLERVGDDEMCRILRWTTTGTYPEWRIEAWDGFVYVVAEDSGATRSPTYYSIDDAYDGQWHHIHVRLVQDGTGLVVSSSIDDETEASETWTSTALGLVQMVQAPCAFTSGIVNSLQSVASLSLAHVAVYDTAVDLSDRYQAVTGFAGETASDRIERLCVEEGVRVAPWYGDSEPMGPQPSATFLDLLRECEAADGGRLAEYDFGLTYRPRSSLYNQAAALTLDGAAGEVAEPFGPVRDLQRLRNEWKISRKDGSSAVYADAASQLVRGRLDDSATINVATDGVLQHHAAWRTALGTVGGLRYPSLSADLGRHPGLIGAWQALEIGDRVQATSPVTQHPPGLVDQLVEGRRQTLTGRTGWRVTLVTSPARPYDVFVVASATLGRLDSSASTLAAAIDADDVTVSVATSSGPTLTTTATYPGDFPFDAEISGERVTVTAISGTSSPQTATVTRSVNGIAKAHAAGTALRLWQPGHVAL